MKLVLGKLTLWTAVTAFLVVLLGAGIQGGTPTAQPAQPAQSGTPAGASILERACSNCHSADVVAGYHYETATGYRDLVDSMIAAGAPLSGQDASVLVDYLFATYGKKQEGGAGTAPAVAVQDPAKAVLESACTTCHGLEPLANHVYDTKDPYEGLIRNMIGYGANVTDAQVGPLAEYMLKTYGKPVAQVAGNASAAPAAPAAADAGKTILESACTTCHGLEPLANHVYDTKDPYEGLIRNMIGYGANVTEAQVGPLAEYMLKTYGKPPAAAAGGNAPAAPDAAAAEADAGKAILESACTACHGLEGLANHIYESKDPYESLVRNMIAYGANVTDAQVPPLVEYMFKTYGKK